MGMKTLLLVLAALLSVACGAPELGSPAYLHALVCTSDEATADALSEAAARWHDAAPKSDVRVMLGGNDGCDVYVERAPVKVAPTHPGSKVFAFTEPGAMTVDPHVPADVLANLVTHEMGHLLIGKAYADADDDEHNPDFASVMFWAVGPDAASAQITARDAALVGSL